MRCECERRAHSMKPDERRPRIAACAASRFRRAPRRSRLGHQRELAPISGHHRRFPVHHPSRPPAAAFGVSARSKTGNAVKPRLGNSCRIRLPRLSQPMPTASAAKRPCECARQSFQQSRRFLTFLAGWSSSPSGAAPGAPPAERLQRKTRALRMLPAAIGPVVDHNKSVQLAG